jgi:hypothetical protein
MISSNYYEFALRSPAAPLVVIRRDALELPWSGTELLPIPAEQSFAITVHRSADASARLRLRLGDEVLAEIPPGRTTFETEQQAWLANEFGESRVLVEQEIEQGLGEDSPAFVPLFELGLAVIPRPEVARDFRVMIEDVTAIHEGLAQDVINRSFVGKRFAGTAVTRLHPEAVLQNFHELYHRLEKALAQIARQPSVMLDRSARVARYRGGDRVDASTLAHVARGSQTRLGPGGQIVSLDKVHVRVPIVSEDLPEHRHVAEGLRRLARSAEQLAQHCERSAELVTHEESRWGSTRSDRLSVFDQRYLPRVEMLTKLADTARNLGDQFLGLLRRHAFLAEAGSPRTPLGPTPVFLGRPAYREVYRALLEARRPLGALVDGHSIRIKYRNLATLYECWCFLRTVAYLRQRLGSPRGSADISLVDKIYRPDLKSGQSFCFPLTGGRNVVVTYEPDIYPWRQALRRGDRLGASLTGEPLRPDITIEVREQDAPGAILVLDAKSTDSFTVARFRDLTDYARLVFDPRTGRQPIRQVFLLHRSRGVAPVTNIPEYLQGREVAGDVNILGAVPCAPERVNQTPAGLAQVIERFLETCGTGE